MKDRTNRHQLAWSAESRTRTSMDPEMDGEYHTCAAHQQQADTSSWSKRCLVLNLTRRLGKLQLSASTHATDVILIKHWFLGFLRPSSNLTLFHDWPNLINAYSSPSAPWAKECSKRRQWQTMQHQWAKAGFQSRGLGIFGTNRGLPCENPSSLPQLFRGHVPASIHL